jgi:arylformamidase
LRLALLHCAFTATRQDPINSSPKTRMTRLATNSEATRARIGVPQRFAYGPTGVERLDIYRTSHPNARVFVFIHGGNWQVGAAEQYGYPTEMFINAGAHYVALDFSGVTEAGGDLGLMAAQVRRGIAWVCKNASTFGGDAERIYIGGHSSGGHLCGVALVTDWQKDFGLPDEAVRAGCV